MGHSCNGQVSGLLVSWESTTLDKRFFDFVGNDWITSEDVHMCADLVAIDVPHGDGAIFNLELFCLQGFEISALGMV